MILFGSVLCSPAQKQPNDDDDDDDIMRSLEVYHRIRPVHMVLWLMDMEAYIR